MTITDKLEGLLPADGKPMTRNDRVIAEAVQELRGQQDALDTLGEWGADAMNTLAKAEAKLDRSMRDLAIVSAATGFAAGCIAGALFGGWG